MTTGTIDADLKAYQRRWRRWRALRRTVAVASWLLLGYVSITVPSLGPRLLGRHSDAGTLTIEQSLQTKGPVGVVAGLLAFAVVVACWGKLATLVDYRYVDGLCLLVPFYNFLWTARIVWRLTYRVSPAPARSWPPARERRESWVDPLARRLNPWST